MTPIETTLCAAIAALFGLLFLYHKDCLSDRKRLRKRIEYLEDKLLSSRDRLETRGEVIDLSELIKE